MKFPVQYFVAPEMATDAESRGVSEITLSYTFYPTKGCRSAAVTRFCHWRSRIADAIAHPYDSRPYKRP